jgi:hypothetical protein
MAYPTDYLDHTGGKSDECSEEDNDLLPVAELVITVSSGTHLTHRDVVWAMEQNEHDCMLNGDRQ